jgi:undecaprenyl-diphosphatase
VAQSLLAHAWAIPVILFLTLWILFYLPLAGIASLAKGTARTASTWVAKSPLGRWGAARRGWHGVRPWAPLIVILLLGAIAATAAAHLFVELAQRFPVSTSRVYLADRAAHEWFLGERQSGITSMLRFITFFGGGTGIALVVSVATVLLVLYKEPATATYLAGTAFGGVLLNTGLKYLFARTRPDLASAATAAHWYSFPSGHAMESFIVYGALAYITLRQPWPWKLDSAVLALVVTMVILIGLSRVYLGVHWVSDIAGGWSAGIVWLVAATVVFDLVLRRRRSRAAKQ